MVLLSVSTLMISSCGFLVVVVPRMQLKKKLNRTDQTELFFSLLLVHLGRTLVALVGLGQISDIYAIVFGFAFVRLVLQFFPMTV